MRRGGRRPRFMPSGEPVSSSSYRWGRRRARVGQCAAILGAEFVYGQLICEGQAFGPGFRATFAWTPAGGSGASWDIAVEVLANAVWRRGRLFFRCGHCRRRATRLYIPVARLEPRCRRCWGLSYESQSWSYCGTGFWGRLMGPLAHATTLERRKQRRHAARARYDSRRSFLAAALSGGVARERT